MGDVDNTNEIDKNELRDSIQSHSKKAEEVQAFLESAWKRYIKKNNESRKEEVDKDGNKVNVSYEEQEYNVDNIFAMIQGPNGDDMITFEEWCTFVKNNISEDRSDINNRLKRISRPGAGELADKKKKMMLVKDLISGYTKTLSDAEKSRLAAEEQRRRAKAKRERDELERKKKQEAEEALRKAE